MITCSASRCAEGYLRDEVLFAENFVQQRPNTMLSRAEQNQASVAE